MLLQITCRYLEGEGKGDSGFFPTSLYINPLILEEIIAYFDVTLLISNVSKM